MYEGWEVDWQPPQYEITNTCGYTWYDTRLHDADCNWLKYAVCEAKINGKSFGKQINICEFIVQKHNIFVKFHLFHDIRQG